MSAKIIPFVRTRRPPNSQPIHDQNGREVGYIIQFRNPKCYITAFYPGVFTVTGVEACVSFGGNGFTVELRPESLRLKKKDR